MEFEAYSIPEMRVYLEYVEALDGWLVRHGLADSSLKYLER